MAFVQKNVNSSLKLGVDLVDLRQRLGMTRAEASQRTKMAESIIKSWEEDAWDLDDAVYAERQLASYVRFLGGNEAYFLQKYRANLRELKIQRKPAEILPHLQTPRLWDFVVGARIWALLGLMVFVGGIGAYLYVLASGIGQAPPLRVDEPVDGAQLTSPLVHVSGETAPETRVTINGMDATVQSDGKFQTDLYVARGVSVLTIEAKRRHGDEVQVTRHVVWTGK